MPGLYWYAPTTSNCSKESSVKESEITAAAQNLKKDNKTSSASVNSVNMGSNLISMSVVLVKVGYEGTDMKFFIPMLYLKIAVKAHLQQNMRKNWK